MAGKETENILQSDQKNLKLKSHGQVRLILKSEIESRHENQQHINCKERKSYKSSSNQQIVPISVSVEKRWKDKECISNI